MRFGGRMVVWVLVLAALTVPSSWALSLLGSAASHRVVLASGIGFQIRLQHDGAHRDHHADHAADHEPDRHDRHDRLEPDHQVSVFFGAARAHDASPSAAPFVVVVSSPSPVFGEALPPSLAARARPGPAPPQPARSVTILRV